MNRPFEHAPEPLGPRAHASDDALLRQLLSELAAGRESAPDLTDTVMGRLGFVRCTAMEARRESRQRLLQRAAVVAVAALAAVGGYFVAASREGAAPRLALAPAVGGAVERHGRSFDEFVKGLPWLPRGVMAMPATMHGPGAADFGVLPIILIPVPVDGRSLEIIDLPDPDCPLQRPTPAILPYPQT